MPLIPPFLLQKLYVKGSLRPAENGFSLELRNTIAPATIVGITSLQLDGVAVKPEDITIEPDRGSSRPAEELARKPLLFPVYKVVKLHITGIPISPGPHRLTIRINVKEVGPLDIQIQDTVST